MSEFVLPAHLAPDEGSLLERARSGDREATDQLVRRYLRDVYEVTHHVLGDPHLAEDAAQDTFVNALSAISRFRGEASFRTWLLRIAVNAARTVGRRKTRRREVDIETAVDVVSEETDAHTRISQRDEANRIESLLPALPEKQRMAVILRLQQGLDYKAVGEALDCSEGAARVNYHLGIKRLRELMK